MNPDSPTGTATGRVVTLGEGLGVLRSAEPGSLAQLSSLAVATGGAEANVAIGLARLGTPVTWAGRVGDDGLGRRVVRELRAEGVEVIAPVDPERTTGLLLKETPSPGRSRVSYYRMGSAGSRLSPADVEALDLDGVALLHLTGITPALSELARAAVERAVARAAERGIPVSFDVNHRSRMWSAEAAAPVYRELVSRAAVVFAGLDEARLVLGDDADPDPEDAAARLAGLGAGEVVVKLGAEGALTLRDGTATRQAAVPVEVVDTVGAGDAFVAGYLAELVAGRPVAERLRTAVATGAAVCRHPGDWEGAATRPELAELRDPDADPVRR